MKEIYKALAAFQQECPVIHKDTKGYGYTYADITAILEVINPLLEKHGLGFTQPVGTDSIKTILFHIESGESIESEIKLMSGVKLSGMNDFQVLGSQITYLRRYALSSVLGIVTDKDIDGNGKQDDNPDNKTPNKEENNNPWLNRNNKSGDLLESYTKVISAAREKQLKLKDMLKHYKISKEVQDWVKQDLGG